MGSIAPDVWQVPVNALMFNQFCVSTVFDASFLRVNQQTIVCYDEFYCYSDIVRSGKSVTKLSRIFDCRNRTKSVVVLVGFTQKNFAEPIIIAGNVTSAIYNDSNADKWSPNARKRPQSC